MEWKYPQKTMVFLRQDPLRSKIIINNKYVEQGSNINYVGSDISYEEKNILTFTQILGIINVL